MSLKATTLVEHLFHTENNAIIERGSKEPFTFERLFRIPKEHTYGDMGVKFIAYFQELAKKGEDLSVFEIARFFKWETVIHFIFTAMFSFSDFSLPLFVKMILDWLETPQEELDYWNGFYLLIGILTINIVWALSVFQLNHVGENNSIRFRNALGVQINSFLFSLYLILLRASFSRS